MTEKSNLTFHFSICPRDYFRKHCWFTNNSQGYKNRLFIQWVWDQTYQYPHEYDYNGKIFHLDAWEFLYTYELCAKETGLTKDQSQERIWRAVKEGVLIKVSEKSSKKYTVYRWVKESFEKKSATNLGDKIDDKSATNTPESATTSATTSATNLGDKIDDKSATTSATTSAPLYKSDKSDRDSISKKGDKSDNALAPQGANIPPTGGSPFSIAEQFSTLSLSTSAITQPPSANPVSVLHFDPKTYTLRNGKQFKKMTQNRYAKIQRENLDVFCKLVSNLALYEQRADEGKIKKDDDHERYLEHLFKNDIAGHNLRLSDNIEKNNLFLYNLRKTQKMQHNVYYQVVEHASSVHLLSQGVLSDTISKELSPEIFQKQILHHLEKEKNYAESYC